MIERRPFNEFAGDDRAWLEAKQHRCVRRSARRPCLALSTQHQNRSTFLMRSEQHAYSGIVA
jgi:hypothetical protein